MVFQVRATQVLLSGVEIPGSSQVNANAQFYKFETFLQRVVSFNLATFYITLI